MLRPRFRRHAIATVLTAALVLSLPAGATTYVMMTDEELADQASVIAAVRILSVDGAPDLERPATDYLVEVEELIQGFVPGSALVVRVPGGVRPDGIGLHFWGAPVFRESSRALLFLNPHRDGTFRIVQFMFGAFREVIYNGRRLAVRHFPGAREIPLPDDPNRIQRQRSHLPRDFQAFTTWLEDRGLGERRPADYFVESLAGELSSRADPFTLTDPTGTCGPGAGQGFRWTQFNNGNSVTWRAHQSGQTGLAGGGFAEFQTALAAWNNDPDTPINLVYGGTTSASQGFMSFDGINAILFDDPNDEMEGTFNGSGTLATGGPWFDCPGTHKFKGKKYVTIVGADVITNDGAQVFFNAGNASKRAEGTFAHELGHTLGLGHSCGDESSPPCAGNPVLNDALMRATAHQDNRGAALNSDDRAGLAALYAPTSGTGPTAPSNLTAATASMASISLNWQDNSTDETGFRIERWSVGGSFAEIATAGAGSTSFTDTGLGTATYYEYRVQATNASGASPYSNTATATTFGLGLPCLADPNTLCLNGNRFKLTATFNSTLTAQSGAARVVELTSDTGYFWFFASTAVEVVAKVIEACADFNRYWVFASGLTNVEVVLTVEDTQTSIANTYINPELTPFQPIQDTSAFATCP